MSLRNQDDDKVLNKFVIPSIGVDIPIFKLYDLQGTPTTELIESKTITRVLMKRYKLIEEIKQDSS